MRRLPWIPKKQKFHCLQDDHADILEEDFIALIDSDGREERLSAKQEEEEQPAVNTAPSTPGRTELPWTRASSRISSPSIRLHNGKDIQRQ